MKCDMSSEFEGGVGLVDGEQGDFDIESGFEIGTDIDGDTEAEF